MLSYIVCVFFIFNSRFHVFKCVHVFVCLYYACMLATDVHLIKATYLLTYLHGSNKSPNTSNQQHCRAFGEYTRKVTSTLPSLLKVISLPHHMLREYNRMTR